MPGRERSLELTDRYRERLLELRRAAEAGVRSQWGVVYAEDLDRTFALWLRGSTAIVAGSQRVALGETRGYLAGYVRSELDEPVAPAPLIDVDGRAGIDAGGRPLERALLPALLTVKLSLTQTGDLERALALGRARGLRIAAHATMAAPRLELAAALERDARFNGWRRAARSGACLACLGAATGALRRTREIPAAHPHCSCVAEPNVAGVRQRVTRPTGPALFAALDPAVQDARYGRRKAELIRAGDVALTQLVTHVPMATEPDGITEAPLTALRS